MWGFPLFFPVGSFDIVTSESNCHINRIVSNPQHLNTQEADGLVYAYILIWVAKNCGRSATGFEGVFLGFYI